MDVADVGARVVFVVAVGAMVVTFMAGLVTFMAAVGVIVEFEPEAPLGAAVADAEEFDKADGAIVEGMGRRVGRCVGRLVAGRRVAGRRVVGLFVGRWVGRGVTAA